MLRLVSKSPRRREILEMAGIEFVVTNIDTDEDIVEKNPCEYVMKTALKKGSCALDLYPDDIILSADTIVVFNNQILEKPKDKEERYQKLAKEACKQCGRSVPLTIEKSKETVQ